MFKVTVEYPKSQQNLYLNPREVVSVLQEKRFSGVGFQTATWTTVISDSTGKRYQVSESVEEVLNRIGTDVNNQEFDIGWQRAAGEFNYAPNR